MSDFDVSGESSAAFVGQCKLYVLGGLRLLLLVTVASMGCAENITIDDEGEPESIPGNQVPNRSEQSNWLEDLILLGDTGVGVNGVDILLVVDNDPAMTPARMRMSTALYSLVTQLLHPIGQAPLLTGVRIAVTSTDLGLQYGRLFSQTDHGEDAGLPTTTAFGCDDFGDNGAFLPVAGLLPEIVLANNQIYCEDYGEQCPQGWHCQMGRCIAPENDGRISCPDSKGASLESTISEPDVLFASKVACMIHGPTSECVVRQPLEAAVKALALNPDFLSKNHLLMILVLSGRDDCSIADPALFEEINWTVDSPRIACFANGNDDKYLYSVESYHSKLLAFKDDNPAAVLFAAIVGAPDVTCTGTGLHAMSESCLLHDDMENGWLEYSSVDEGTYWDLEPVCKINTIDSLEDAPKPGRRLVKLATKFGENGYVQSICSAQWNSMVNHLAGKTLGLLSRGECRIDRPLKVRSMENICPGCISSRCRLLAKFVRTGEAAKDTSCPDALVNGDDFQNRGGYIPSDDKTLVFCPLENLSTPLGCREAAAAVAPEQVGWYYCERQHQAENSEATCSDGVDNDGDDVIDCDQSSCAGCFVCGSARGCELGCDYNVVLSERAANIIGGQSLVLQCPSDIMDF